MRKTFIITYELTVKTVEGELTAEHQIIVRNQLSEQDAKENLEAYLKRKYGSRFVCVNIKKCLWDSLGLSAFFP